MTIQTATQFGKLHLAPNMQERIKFDNENPGAGQAGYYLADQNGQSLLWQLRRLSEEQLSPYKEQFAIIAKRAARRAFKYPNIVAYANTVGYAGSVATATTATNAIESASCAVSCAAACATEIDGSQLKELMAQAEDIKELIPFWPGE